MKVIDISIDQIKIGERRRQDYGDISALAKGMKRVGLLEPIVVDRNGKQSGYRLVAGERRLKAAQMLKWAKIPASLLEDLTDAELRDLELEENENRKSLTEGERRRTFASSKRLVENTIKAAEVLGAAPSTAVSISYKGGTKANAAPQQAIADALGTSRRAIERAKQHVDTSERYSWLQSDAWLQADILRLRRHFKRIPVEEQPRLYQFIEETAAPLEPRPDRVVEFAEVMSIKTPEERAEIYQLWESDDDRDQSLAQTRALHRPPMPDVRSTHIRDAVQVLKRALKPPLDVEPENGEFQDIIRRLKALEKRIDARYQELKRKERDYVEEDIRRRKATISA